MIALGSVWRRRVVGGLRQEQRELTLQRVGFGWVERAGDSGMADRSHHRQTISVDAGLEGAARSGLRHAEGRGGSGQLDEIGRRPWHPLPASPQAGEGKKAS